MGNISSSNPKYTSASNNLSKSSNNSTNNGDLSDSTYDGSNDSTDDGSSDSSNESSSDSSNESSSDISRYSVTKNKLKRRFERQYKRRLKQKYKRRFKRQQKRRYKSDSTNNDSSDSSNGSSNDSDISRYNVIKDKLKDEELCESLELYERRFKSDSTNNGSGDSTDDGSSDSSNESSNDSSNSNSSDISRYSVTKNKLNRRFERKYKRRLKQKYKRRFKRQYKRQLKQKYKQRFKRQYKQRYKSDSTNNDSSDSSNGNSNDNDISQYNVIKDKLKDKELCESLELYERRFKSDSSNISWYNTIKNKLKNEKIYNSLGKKELNELILSLGDETIFLNRYLKLDDNHLNEINRDLQKLDRLQGNNFIPSEKDGRDLVNGLLRRRREADKFNVYLFIKKLSVNRSDSSFLRYLANSLFRNKYGMFHVGLEIDGIVLEWGTGDAGPHLIYPRINTNKIYEKIAHIRVNYDSNFSREFNHSTNTFLQNWRHHMQNFISVIKNYIIKLLNFVLKIGVVPSNKLQIIAQKCVYWNRNYDYDPLNRNCQHFINEILEALNLKFNPEGEFKKFLDRIVKYADDRFLFQEIEFLSRQDLDQFADQNWNMITNSWDKRLLLCYSDMMNNMFECKYDENWGPMNNKEKWIEREYELRTD
ncbi:hypothetical protein RhiirA4_505330 [Rhizophagus irregularis]|uniref:PPPDE domain-containing protein n=1 Tax=Rhizophagus irregularis TaxID=588596 RepID=A0A2I1G6Z7_9GLOM|nr:hypothetical protein RhiirA4_505330 [Rhizophagus irregularis]